MEFGEILRYILMGAGALALIALFVALIQLAKTLKTTQVTIEDLKKQLDPTLEHVNNITAALEPTLAKVDPVMDRVQLTLEQHGQRGTAHIHLLQLRQGKVAAAVGNDLEIRHNKLSYSNIV